MEQMLTDAQWRRLAPLLPGRAGTSGGRGRDNRQFVEAVLWLARNGARWRALPAARGNWHTTYTRFQRWARSGVWQRVFEAVQDEAALHTLLVDSTTVRAHQHASGARKKTDPQALGRSRGGLTTKMHVAADARGRLRRCRLTAGQRHDAPQALPLLAGLTPDWLIADRGYDSDPLVAELARRGTQAVIPPRRKRRHPRPYDAVRYAQRHPVERLFSRLKQFRRLATRYEKLDAHFLAFIYLAATVLWLRDC
ncbi:IS5 family transposase [Hymenobacter sublimis]|uniref:IS5 family transposase n=1 Tax=Hymenobacter sublimis TaxID=2933777 RepID=A0ABY4JE13_9BACT|nr:IS5 family transposase [Hymenobacter sublimis]UPL51070.1 IS5 family transposase [Hymenobacter sublimis]